MSPTDIIPENTAGKTAWQSVATAVVALVGLGDSVYLTGKHFAGSVVPCDLVSGCEKVLTSQWSEIAGVPLAAFGALAYFIAFSLSVLVFFGRNELWKLFGLQSFTMAAFSGWLFYLQASEIGAFCQFCLLSAASSVMLLTLFVSSLLKKIFLQIALVVAVLTILGAAGVTILSGGEKKVKEPEAFPVGASLASAPVGAEPANLKGSASASVTIEEFIDFQCDACAAKHPIVKELVEGYGDKVAFTIRNFPVGERKRAYDAALAAEAAGMQGRFWEMYDKLFEKQSDWSTSDEHRRHFADYAKELGIDIDRFKADMDSEAVRSRIEADLARGKAAGVRSTPSLYINGTLLPFKEMTREGLKSAIDTLLPQVSN